MTDNGGREVILPSTPMNAIGEHEIDQITIDTDKPVEFVDTQAINHWVIKLKNTTIDSSGFEGRWISLEPENDSAILYKIVEHNYNSIIVATSTHLSRWFANRALDQRRLVGVHSFDSVRVTGGAHLDFADDKIRVNNLADAFVDEISAITLSPRSLGMVAAFNNVNDQNHRGSVLLNDAGAQYLSGINLTIDGDLTVNGDTQLALNVYESVTVNGNVSIGSGASLTAAIRGPWQINGDLTIANGAVLSVDPADQYSSHPYIFGLDLTVSGKVTVETVGLIDLEGKGAPATYNFQMDDYGSNRHSHGGVNNVGTDTSYGRFERATQPGSGGEGSASSAIQESAGGGLLTLSAAEMTLNGVINANGKASSSASYLGGAGGGVHIDVAVISGTGSIEAKGAGFDLNSQTNEISGGGRISIWTNDATVIDWQQPGSGIFASTTSDYVNTSAVVAGSGTVFIKTPAESYGHLIVDNGSTRAHKPGVYVRSVGEATIASVNAVNSEDNAWFITIDSDESWNTDPHDDFWTFSIAGTYVTLNADDPDAPVYRVLRGQSRSLVIESTDDLSALNLSGKRLLGVRRLDRLSVVNGAYVSFGDDRLEILDTANSTLGELSGIDASTSSTATELWLQANPYVYTYNGLTYAGAITVPENSSGSLAVQGINVDGDIAIGANASYEILGEQALSINGDLTLSPGSTLTLTGESVVIAGDLTVSDASLHLGINTTIVVQGNLLLEGNATLTTPTEPNPLSSYLEAYPLRITVMGIVTIGENAVVNLAGLGNDSSGFDYSREGCHAGAHSNVETVACSYGSYEYAAQPGAGYSGARGGGVLTLHAPSVQFNGLIDVDGAQAYRSYYPGGAGGSVHIETASLQGKGRITARGTGYSLSSTTNDISGGGRISIITPFTDSVTLDQADTSRITLDVASQYQGSVGGAGTVFVKSPAQNIGHLWVDNGGHLQTGKRVANTAVPSVGEHEIVTVEKLSEDNRYRIIVANSPWSSANAEIGAGIVGRLVSLDAEDAQAPLLRILTNTSSSFEVESADDLTQANLVGNKLIGVHNLATLNIVGGGHLSFGDDLVTVDDLPGSEFDDSSGIVLSERSTAIIDHLGVNNDWVVINHVLYTPELSFTDAQTHALQAEGIVITGDLDIGGTSTALTLEADDTITVLGRLYVADSAELDLIGQSVHIEASLEAVVGAEIRVGLEDTLFVGGDLILSGDSHLRSRDGSNWNALRLNVTGDVSIDNTSSIDVQALGHLYQDAGPYGYYDSNRFGCHGGMSSGVTMDCTYGDYRYALFAGSASTSSNSRGGGQSHWWPINSLSMV